MVRDLRWNFEEKMINLELIINIDNCSNLNIHSFFVIIFIIQLKYNVRIYIIFVLSIFRIEYNLNLFSHIVNKSNWLSSAISSIRNSSIDIVYDSDDCDWDNLDFLRYYNTSINDSGSSSTYSYISILLWIMTWQS